MQMLSYDMMQHHHPAISRLQILLDKGYRKQKCFR